MADNILKNEFMWEEKKQEKKKLYKNWKLYAITLGITVIGAGTGLGVYYGVFANHSDVVKIDLSTLEFETIISGKENMKTEDAFQLFLNANKDITDLETNVEAGTFIIPKYIESGSLTINATTTGKYTGTITVIINAIGQTDLNNLTNLNTILPEAFTNKQDAFNAFLDLNQEKYSDLKGNIETGTFTEPTYTKSGSLTINATATGKYTGTITVTINEIGQIDLNDLTNLVKEVTNTTTKENALQAFLNANKDKHPDLENNVTFDENSFKEPDTITLGFYIINATKDGKYFGSIEVKINLVTEREKALQQIKDAYLRKNNTDWIDSWNNYLFNLQTITNSITYTLTNEELESNTKTQQALFNQFKLIVNEELIKWNVPKGYDENSIKIDYDSFNIADGTITANSQMHINLYNVDLDTSTSHEYITYFEYTINYVIVD